MKIIQEEQYEYEKFMLELANKSHEINQDFNRLSEENKCRVKCELMNVIAARGLNGVLEYINMNR